MKTRKKKKLTIKLKQHQIREAAMRQVGIDPAQWAMRQSKRIEVDRKLAAKAGYVKHKMANTLDSH